MAAAIWMYMKAFAVGGLLCALGEVLVLKTKLTPARILVAYITAGVFLSAVGLYGPLAAFAGAGATIPLTVPFEPLSFPPEEPVTCGIP